MEEKVWLLIEGERVKWEAHQGVSYSGRGKKPQHIAVQLCQVSKMKHTAQRAHVSFQTVVNKRTIVSFNVIV